MAYWFSRHSRFPRRAPIGVEPLEGKALLAVSIFEDAGQLWILGDNRPNNVQILDLDGLFNEAEASIIDVLADGQLYTTSTQITQINIDLRNGNDRLTYDLGEKTVFQTYFPERIVNVSMGNGNDQALLRINGFTFESATDLVALGPGTWNFRFDLGNGNDSWAGVLDADLLGLERDGGATDSILSIGVSGGSGNDRIEFDTTRALNLQLAQFSLAMRGGSGNDQLTARSNGEITLEEASMVFERYGESGNDRILGILETTTLGESIVDQLIDTGTGNDHVNTLFRQRSRRRPI